jgi:spermidine/putrescine transport system ATP-binding protein
MGEAGTNAHSGSHTLDIRGVRKAFGSNTVLDGIDLHIPGGEFITLLGPSGCGKTTLLRIIAGLELPDSGSLLLGGVDLTRTPAAKRPVNTVFQSYALFPHLSVRDNVAFGLRSRGVAAGEVSRRVSAAIELVQIAELADRKPDTLSGGQKQRVALARAVVNEPAVLLLDEPMSALDAKLRTRLQAELRALHRRLGTTFLLVTHDQEEAMSVSDRIVVMNKGRIEQSGTPHEIYDSPRTRFVADFIGAANVLEIKGRRDGCVVTELGELRVGEVPPNCSHVCVRPEDVRLVRGGSESRCVVEDVIFRGESTEVVLGPTALRASMSPGEAPGLGERVGIDVSADRVRGLHG